MTGYNVDNVIVTKLTRRYPTLFAAVESGLVCVEGGSYVGTAADGVVVMIGTVGFERGAERYLVERPTPDMW